MQDLLAGHVQVMFDGLGTSSSQIAGNKLHAIALAAPQRSPTVPNVPTTAEAGMPDYRVSTWYALWAPKGTPAAVIERMQREIKTAHGKDIIKEIWAKSGSDIPTLAGADFGKFVTSEIARWGKVVKEANVRLE
jgi:tripartite-type tricarboxylate transporter receptor subunit TctC